MVKRIWKISAEEQRLEDATRFSKGSSTDKIVERSDYLLNPTDKEVSHAIMQVLTSSATPESERIVSEQLEDPKSRASVLMNNLFAEAAAKEARNTQ